MRGDRRVQLGPSQARARSWEPTPKRPGARTVLARGLLSTPSDKSPLGQTPGKENGHGGRPLGRRDSIRLFTPRCTRLCQTRSLPGRLSSRARRLRRCLPEQAGCPRAAEATGTGALYHVASLQRPATDTPGTRPSHPKARQHPDSPGQKTDSAKGRTRATDLTCLNHENRLNKTKHSTPAEGDVLSGHREK